MAWELLVDYRERGLLAELAAGGDTAPPHRSTNLAVGDVQLRQGSAIRLVIERKTVADLEASLCDGRYREQKARLLSTVRPPAGRVAYLVEGDLRAASRLNPSNLYGALTGLWVRDGVAVLRSADLAETCTLLRKLYARRDLFAEVPPPTALTEAAAAYGSSCPVRRRRDAPPAEVYVLMLRQVPGVSATIARTVRAAYPHMHALVAALGDDKGRLAHALAQLTYATRGGPRRVGRVVSERLCDFLSPGWKPVAGRPRPQADPQKE